MKDYDPKVITGELKMDYLDMGALFAALWPPTVEDVGDGQRRVSFVVPVTATCGDKRIDMGPQRITVTMVKHPDTGEEFAILPDGNVLKSAKAKEQQP